jgi:hypothetical protein
MCAPPKIETRAGTSAELHSPQPMKATAQTLIGSDATAAAPLPSQRRSQVSRDKSWPTPEVGSGRPRQVLSGIASIRPLAGQLSVCNRTERSERQIPQRSSVAKLRQVDVPAVPLSHTAVSASHTPARQANQRPSPVSLGGASWPSARDVLDSAQTNLDEPPWTPSQMRHWAGSPVSHNIEASGTSCYCCRTQECGP